MKNNFAIIALGFIAIITVFTAHIGQHPESSAAEWLHDTAAPAITNTIKDFIKAIPFSGLINWQ